MGRELPRKLRQDALDANGQPRIDRDNGLRRGSGLAQVGVVIGIQHWLVIHQRMNGGDSCRLDTKRVVEGRQNRHYRVGRAGSR